MPHSTRSLMSPSPWRWAGWGAALGLLLACVLWAPARWLASGVAQATHGMVQLRQARGTIWSGDAVLTLTPGDSGHESRSLPTRLRWQWGMTWSGLTLALSSPCCTPAPLQWQLGLQGRQWRLWLLDQSSQWPLSLLAGLGAPWNTLQTEGQMQWQSTGLGVSWGEDQWRLHGETRLQLQDLASRLSTVRPMGSYRVTLEGGEAGTPTPALSLTTLTGPLHLSGQGQWTGQQLRFQGEASAEEGTETALSNLLNIIGRREGPRSRLSLG